MAGDGATSATLSTLRANALIEALHDTLTLKPADDIQQIAQPEMVKALQMALDARRQRIVVSQSAVGMVKSAGILLFRDCARWSPSPWLTTTTGLPAL